VNFFPKSLAIIPTLTPSLSLSTEKSGAYHIILVEFNTTMSDAEQIDFAKEFSSTVSHKIQ
jgi:hypothetical protein